ncbi:hypothetical protein M422DRAFT_197782 [Sphaerobolus stellatus SS14]|nr:hypothetical protein M422DRAFT_197782 [Sphaerobolus stellatus SS14]
MASTTSVGAAVSEFDKLSLDANTETKDESRDSTTLTPIRAHYLKKTLISLQFSNELTGLTQISPNPAISALSYLGAPFAPPPKDAPVLDFPFMRFTFRQFVLSFPFLAAAPKDFFPQKVQPFITSVLSRNLSATSPFDEDAERTEQATREKILIKAEKQFSTLLGSATKLHEDEEVVRLTQKDLDRLETLARKRRAKQVKHEDTFDVNVIGVRTIIDKGRVRSKAHEEFIIRTRRAHGVETFVSRRYGDFMTLAKELRKAHPDIVIPSPPAKDRSAVDVAPILTSPTNPSQNLDDYVDFERSDTFDHSYDSQSAIPATARLSREKNRLTLRAYLHTLFSSSTLTNSPVLRSFLTSGAIQLNAAEFEDARRREEADQVREEGRKRFAKELAAKVDALREAMKGVKRDIMGKDGLIHAFAVIQATEDIRELPPDFKAVLEWARISFASTIFHHFIATDSASQTLVSLKRIHKLMPYGVLRVILKISNPVAMIRGVLDLFLAQTWGGGGSLLQRMVTSGIAEEVKALQEQIDAVKDKVEDDTLCEKIRLFVYAPAEIQALFKADAAAEKFDILTVVLRSSEEPILNSAQMQRVIRAHRAYAEYKRQKESLDSDDDDGPQNEDAWLYEDLTILGKLYTRLRDRQQLMELIFEGTTAQLLKDIITIFYSPLAEVYKAASIGESLGHFQNFIDDLIATVERADAGQLDPSSTVKMFVELVQRHEQDFYNFVHKVHSKGAKLFENLLRWIELFINFVREGLGEPISLEFLLPHTGQERIDILKEVDAVALYHYRLKVAHETKVRRRFGRGEGGEVANGGPTTADQDDLATQALIDDVVRDFNFGDLVNGDVEDLVDTDSSGEDSEEYDSSEETTTEEETELESDEEDHVPRPMAPPSPATRRIPSTAPLPTLHKRASQSTVTIPGPPPKPLRPKRSFSLRLNRSTSDLRRAAKLSDPPPPVPPLPGQLRVPVGEKDVPPLPPPLPSKEYAPSVQSSSSTQTARGQRSPPADAEQQRASSSAPTKKKKKKTGPDIQGPELKAIPSLLPLFVEMMRPKLRPRQV